MRVAFHTLGCKLNQLETEALADAFRRIGARIMSFEAPRGPKSISGTPGQASREEGADLYILNTCTVTSKAEQKARRLIRAALASRPEAVVLVTGCYAQLEAPAISALNERAVVVPGEEKASIGSLADWLADSWQGHGDLLDAVLAWRREARILQSAAGTPAEGSHEASDRFAFIPEEFTFHSRPSLKIQDGCDNRCTYCRVCLARGPSTSLPASEVLARLKGLEAAGRAEAVLTGVNLFQYRDEEGRSLPALLRFLLEGTKRIALRLSSYEPEGVSEEFLEVFASSRIRPHLHLPVQSGSDPVLARMGRAYRRGQVLGVCEKLRRVKGDLFLAADMIAGFPGETEEDFSASLTLVRDCRFAWIHAFPFSPRPGTKAWNMGPRVPERIARERVLALTQYARSGRADYLRRWIGLDVEAVLEGSVPKNDDRISSPRHATAENYLKLSVEGLPAEARPGAAIRCRILSSLSEEISGGSSPQLATREAEALEGAPEDATLFLGEADARASSSVLL